MIASSAHNDSLLEAGVVLAMTDEKNLDDDFGSEQDVLLPSGTLPMWQRLSTKVAHVVQPFSLRSSIGCFGFALLPSFLQQKLRPDRTRSERLRSTAYLDGMRGLAALFVFFCHYSYTSFVITVGYGHGEAGENRNLLQLPIIRLFYSGPPMVCLFFVISGYALSHKPVRQLRSRSWEGLFTTMTSSIFRRALRLFLPTTISTLLVVVMLRLGFYEATRAFAGDKNYLRNVLEFHPVQLPSLGAQLQDWGWKVFNFIHVWGWELFGGSTDYDVHLWTIPVEFRCSMVLFLVIIGLARVKTWIRFSVTIGLVWFSYLSSRWEVILFLAGMSLAELDIIPSDNLASRSAAQPAATVQRRHAPWIILFIAALYLMSQPDQFFESTPGWVWLSALIPEWFAEKYRFWQCIGSMLFVLATNRSSILQKPFNSPIVQYFGHISYALYLMHGPVIHTIGYRIEALAWGVTGLETDSQYIFGFVLAGIINIPLVIWASDLFWRYVDIPSVRFARWLETKCIA